MKDQRIQFVAFIALMATSQLCMTLNLNKGGQGSNGYDRRDEWRGANGGAANGWAVDAKSGRRRGGDRSISSRKNVSKSDIAAKIRKYEEENRRIRTDNSILGYELEDLNKNNVKLREEQDRLRVDGEQYTKNAKEIEILKAKIAANQGQINDLRNQLSKYTDVEKENENLRKRINDLQWENSDAEARVSKLQKTIDALKQRISELEVQNKEIEDLKKTINELTNAVNEKEKIISSLKDQLDSANINVEQLQKEIKYLEEKLQAEIQTIAKIRAEIAEANTQITALNRQIIELKNQLTKKDSDIDAWKGKIKPLEQEIESLNGQVKKLQDLVADREELIRRITYLQEKLYKLQRKLNNHKHSSRRDGWGAKSAKSNGGKTTILVGSSN